MTTTGSQLDTGELEQRVKRMYEEVALEADSEFHFETGRALAERLGYPATALDQIPAEAIESFAGVGYFLDLAAIVPGESVIDLGSGSGMDSFLAAALTGTAGRVVGIDMTDAQLAKARRLATAAGYANVEFRNGYIERPQVDDATFDCVISNGVINLSPDKPAVFAAAEHRELSLALRFSTGLCLALVVVALALHSPAMIFALSGIGLVAGLSARHPFDHLWNRVVRHLVGGPILPPNPTRRRHAFKLATVWLASVGVLLAVGATTAGLVLGGLLVVACGAVTVANLCIPSELFAWWERRATRKQAAAI